MNKKWRKLLELSTLECLLLLFVLLLFPFIVVLLKKRGLRCTQSFLSLLAIPLFPYNIDGEDEPALILGQRIARIVQIGAAAEERRRVIVPS